MEDLNRKNDNIYSDDEVEEHQSLQKRQGRNSPLRNQNSSYHNHNDSLDQNSFSKEDEKRIQMYSQEQYTYELGKMKPKTNDDYFTASLNKRVLVRNGSPN